MPPLHYTNPSGGLNIIVILVTVILAVAVLILTIITPGFWIDGGLVYGGF